MKLIWPVTVNYITQQLRSVGLSPRLVKVGKRKHKRKGYISFHIELPPKYNIIPADEIKDRLWACLEHKKPDRVIERRVRSQIKHVSIDFTLDCSQWVSLLI